MFECLSVFLLVFFACRALLNSIDDEAAIRKFVKDKKTGEMRLGKLLFSVYSCTHQTRYPPAARLAGGDGRDHLLRIALILA